MMRNLILSNWVPRVKYNSLKVKLITIKVIEDILQWWNYTLRSKYVHVLQKATAASQHTLTNNYRRVKA